MQAEDSKRRLYALARDEAERQRLIAAFQINANKDTSRELFELLAYYFIIAAAAFGMTFLIYRVAESTPGLSGGKVLFTIILASFFGSIFAINLFLGSKYGRPVSEKIDSICETHAHVITLIVGLLAGNLMHGYYQSRSDTFRIKEIAVAACLQSASCLSIAKSANQGDDIRWYVGPLAK